MFLSLASIRRSGSGRALYSLCRLYGDERGQTTTEYTAVLVVAAGLALAVGWFLLSPILETALNQIETFVLRVFG